MKRTAILLATLLFTWSFAAGQTDTGLQPFGSFGGGPFDVVNLGALNTHFEVNVTDKAGRIVPFFYRISYDSLLWSPVNSFGASAWTPQGNYGWQAQTDAFFGYVTYTQNNHGPCPTKGDESISRSNYVYHDSKGGSHSFPLAFIYISDCNTNTSTYTGIATDGSGITLSIDGSTPLANTITTRDGAKSTVGPSQFSSASLNNTNGNEITTTGTTFTDTLGSTALTISGTPTSPPVTYSFTNSSGGNSTVQVAYTSYTIQTNFGCTGITEYSAAGVNLPTTITQTDGNQYQFTYEQTPGYPAGNTTGRIASVTLPTGGTITYAYTGSHDGINCSDGSITGLTRTLSPASGVNEGNWTYARVFNSNNNLWQTTVTDPANNQTVLNFAAFAGFYFETSRSVYQGTQASGMLLLSVTHCWNGTCTPGVSAPINQVDVYTQPAGAPSSAHEEVLYNSYGLPTSMSAWDYGASTASRVTSITYASPGNGIVSRPSDITVTDGSGTKFAETQINYDETALASTSLAPNHDYTIYNSSFTQRGNPTTIKRWVSGTTFVTTTNTYNDLGNLLTSTDQAGHVTSFDYTDSYSDGTNHNTQAFVTKITYPQTYNPLTNGSVNHIVSQKYYWPSAMLDQVSDQNGQITTYTYDGSWRPLTVAYPDGGGTTYSYPNSQQVEVQNKIDTTRTTDSWSEVDGLGRPSRKAVANGENIPYNQADICYDPVNQKVTSSYEYQGFGIASGPNGARQCSSSAGDVAVYDALGRTTSVTHSDTGSVLTSYKGRAVKVQDEGNGFVHVTHAYQMDGLGRTTSVCEEASSIFASTVTTCGLDSDPTASGVITSYSYDPLGNIKTITQGAITPNRQFTYDGLSHLLSEYIPETKGTTSYTYNSLGLLATRSRYSANQAASCIGPPNTCTTTTTTYSFDELNRLRTVSYSDAVSENTPFLAYFYDQPNPYGLITSQFSIGRLAAAWTETHGFNAGIQGALFGYDQMGRENIEGETLINVCCNPQYILNYGYDLAGLLTSSTNSQGVTFNYSYNVGARPTQMTSSLSDANHPATLVNNLHYGPFGLVSGQLGNGVTESFGYNGRGLMQSFFSKPYSLNLTLAANGNIAAANDTLTRLQISSSMLSESGLSGFDQTQITDGDVSTNGWHTDTAGPGAWLQVDLGATNAQAVTEVRVYNPSPPYNGQYSIQYSDDGANWTTAASGFTPNQQGWNAQSWASVGAHRYWRLYLVNTPGPGAFLTELELIAPATGVNGSWTYGYDALNRIATANQTGGSSLSFDIDRNSNRWHQNPNGAQLGFDQSSNQISGNGVTYDALGNIINDGVNTYTYDAEGRLTQVAQGATVIANYVYDALGRRTRRAVGGVNYDDIYDLNGHMITEAGSGHWYRGEVYLGGHLATYWNSTTYFPLTDWLGSERVRTDVNGNVAGTCTGNPYGDNYSCTGTDPSPIKYAGMEYDSETQLYHTQFRYYRPSWGLWMNPDPAGMGASNPGDPQSLNRFAYVGHNPLNAIDSLGLGQQKIDVPAPTGPQINPFALLNAYFDWYNGLFVPGSNGFPANISDYDFNAIDSSLADILAASGGGLSFDGRGGGLSGETLGLPSGLGIPPVGLGDVLGGVLGVPNTDPVCDFVPNCGNQPVAGFSSGGGTAVAGAIGGTILCEIAEPCGVVEDIGLIILGIGALLESKTQSNNNNANDNAVDCWNQFIIDLKACESAYPPGPERDRCYEAARARLAFCRGKTKGPVQ